VSARDQLVDRCRPVNEYGAAGSHADLARVTQEMEGLNRRIEEAHRVGGVWGWGLGFGVWGWGSVQRSILVAYFYTGF